MKYISIILNWRIIVITLLAAVTLLLVMADSESAMVLFGTKVLAVVIGFVTNKLAKHWDGKMPELNVFNDDEGITF